MELRSHEDRGRKRQSVSTWDNRGGGAKHVEYLRRVAVYISCVGLALTPYNVIINVENASELLRLSFWSCLLE